MGLVSPLGKEKPRWSSSSSSIVGYFPGGSWVSFRGDHWGNLRGLTTGDQIETKRGEAYGNQHSDLGGLRSCLAAVPKQRTQPASLPISRAQPVVSVGLRAQQAVLPDLGLQTTDNGPY